ncbi:hypothetical protein ACSSS7_006077 [Eimeria intestinalis]
MIRASHCCFCCCCVFAAAPVIVAFLSCYCCWQWTGSSPAPFLLDLRESITMYASALESRRLADRQVWLLKQSPSGATLCLAETLVAIVYCAIIGLPLLPLWAPLRIIASILANKQREKVNRFEAHFLG